MQRCRALRASRPLCLSLSVWLVTLAHGQGPGPMPVVVAPVTERDIPPAIRLVGTVRPDKAAVVAAEVSGVIRTFEAQEGQFLKVGEVICRLDPTVSQLRLAEAEAALASLQANLAELENGERPEEITRLEARVAEGTAMAEKWDFERAWITTRFAEGQASSKEKHDVEMEHLAATQRLEQAKAQFDRARNGARAEELTRARQAVGAQVARVRLLRRDLEKTEIRAPFDGALVAKRTEVGEWIEAGGDTCEMVAIDTVKVRVDVPESAVAFARAGAPTAIESDALGPSVAAALTRVIPRATAAARTFPVEIDLPNSEHTLLPGMFVWVYVPSGPRSVRLLVSKDAIVGRGTSKQVYVVRPGPAGTQMAIPTPITTGLELEQQVEIVGAGLKPGDLLVTRGNERLFGPTPVLPLPAGADRPPPVETKGAEAAAAESSRGAP